MPDGMKRLKLQLKLYQSLVLNAERLQKEQVKSFSFSLLFELVRPANVLGCFCFIESVPTSQNVHSIEDFVSEHSIGI